MTTEKRKTKKKDAPSEKKATPEEQMEALIAKTEKKLLAKLDEVNSDLEALAEQIVIAQKALAEDMGVDLTAVYERMREQTRA